MSRRTVLGVALAGVGHAALGAGLPRAAGRQSLVAERLGDDLVLLRQDGVNIVVVAAPEGLTFVDGGLARNGDELLKRAAAAFPRRPVRNLFNTHWHWDHSGGNERLARAGAALYAHENTRLWLGVPIDTAWDGRHYAARPPRALPNNTFHYGVRTLAFGGGTLEYGYLPQAHTDGDIYVFAPAHDLLVAGDVVTGGDYPVLDYSTGGWLGGMVASLKLLLTRVDSSTRVVPGSGALRTRADVQAQLEMCQTVLGRISESYYKGNGLREFLASAPTREFDATWGDPALFLRTAFEGAWGHITEIRRAAG